MNTSSEAIQRLNEALSHVHAASGIIDDLIVAHDYQDVATLVAQAAAALVEATVRLLEAQDEPAVDALERADDLLDAVWAIIDGETDED